MYRLPLFPLPAILLPGGRIPLHIFEPRYRRMVARCLEFDKRFGLLYHDPDRRGPFLMEEGRVGCVAEIEAFKPLPDGRSLLLAEGIERFRVREGIASDEPYYEAVVEPYEDRAPASPGGLRSQRERSVTYFRAAALAQGTDEDELPEMDPDGELSFTLASTLQIDPSWLQALLEIRDERRRLERLDSIFQAAARQAEG